MEPTRISASNEVHGGQIIQKADVSSEKSDSGSFQIDFNLFDFLLGSSRKHHEILGKLAAGTYSSDKVQWFLTQFIRVTASLSKFLRSYNLVTNIKGLEWLSYQLMQLRRLLRLNRVLTIISQLLGKKNINKHLLILKAIMLVSDANDCFAYLMQLKVLKEYKLTSLKRNVADLYFVECLGWLSYYVMTYSSCEQDKKRRHMMMIFKLGLDCFSSMNDFSGRWLTFNPKITSLVSLTSSLINIVLIWH